MNRQELETRLRKIDVSREWYNLQGAGRPVERFSLRKLDGKWEVYFAEKGTKTTHEIFDSEDEACLYIYKKFAKQSLRGRRQLRRDAFNNFLWRKFPKQCGKCLAIQERIRTIFGSKGRHMRKSRRRFGARGNNMWNKRSVRIMTVIIALAVFALAYRIAFSEYFWVGDIQDAIDDNDIRALEQLLGKGYDIDTPEYPDNDLLCAFLEPSPRTSLDYACENGSYEAVKAIVDAGADVNGTDDGRWPPLILVLRQYDEDDLAVVEYLLENGADPDRRLDGDYPLTVAANMLVWDEKAGVHYYNEKRAAGVLEVIKLLLEHADNPEAKDSLGKSAFLCASDRGNLLVMEYLAEEQGFDVNETDNNGQTAAFYYSDLDDRTWVADKISLLKKLGIDLEIRDDEGRTASDYTREQEQYWISSLIEPEE